MEGQINLFEYVESITDPTIRIKEILNDVKARIASKGYKCDWVDEIIDPQKPGTCFVKNGHYSYKSTCNNYEGYFLCGCIGSVKCKCAGLLPGVIGDEICFQENRQCPYLEQEDKQ